MFAERKTIYSGSWGRVFQCFHTRAISLASTHVHVTADNYRVKPAQSRSRSLRHDGCLADFG